MPFSFKKTEIEGIVIVKPLEFSDNRGKFLELNTKLDFESNGIKYNFCQDNISISKEKVIRGLHYQKKPFEQAKIVTVIQGKIFDVAVDLRKKSKTFGKYFGMELNDKEYTALYIPEGFAHGFCSLEKDTVVLYKNSNIYNKNSEAGIIWNDPMLDIAWPVDNPIISNKDSCLPKFGDL